MLSLAQLKAHLKVDDEAENDLITGYFSAATAAFAQESKRRWPAEGEPALTQLIDPLAVEPEYRFVGYVDTAVLSPDEQAVAEQWLRLVIGHWYENRTVQVVALSVADVPLTAKYLMNILRVPTL